MIQPILKNDALLDSIRAGRDASGFRLWWLGQSGFLLQYAGRHVLLDPYLSDSLTKKYATTDKPHTRMTELVIDPRRLDFIDIVTSSHNHTDHLDPDTLLPLIQANPALKIILPEANRAFAAERLGVSPQRFIGLDDGAWTTLNPFTFIGVPSAHEQLETDPAGHHRYLGYIIRFGPWSIYHSGDTIRYDGMAGKLRPFKVDLALLPINGRAPERRVAGNLSGREAAQLAHDIGAAMVIPHHFDMFTFNTASPEEFLAECHDLDQSCRLLRCGEMMENGEV